MTQMQRGLGRGLSALLPQQREGSELREVPVEAIRPNPRQPRTVFADDQLAELAASIAAVGLLQPVIVREVEQGFELIAGERRLRASKLAGLDRIQAIVRTTEDERLLQDALIENLQRVDLDPLEEAAGFRRLIDDLGLTHEEVAKRVGRSRAAVTNALRLLSLAPAVQERISSGVLSAAHGRALAALADHDAQVRAAQRIAAEELSVRATEEMVRMMAGAGTALRERAGARTATSSERPAGILQAEVMLSDILSTRVSVEHGRRRGKIVIEFADVDDLDRIVRHIGGA